MEKKDMKPLGRIALVAATCAALLASGAGRLAAGELVPGGGFESGDFAAGWIHGAAITMGPSNPGWADHAVVPDLPWAGRYAALLGFKYAAPKRDRYGYMYTDVAIPANISRATLSFRFRQQGYDGANYDPFQMVIRSTSGAPLAAVVNHSLAERGNRFKDSGWIEAGGDSGPGFDMTAWAGQTVRLDFRQYNTTDNNYRTWVFVDDVSLVYRRFVDLAVDGDGDDLFGGLRTGGGGGSVKSRTAGETASYSLEIENEGLDADSYVLSTAVSVIAWTVTIRHGGGDYPLPWTTPALAAGEKIEVQVLVATTPETPPGGYETILDAVSTAHDNRYDSVTLGTNIVAALFLTDLEIDSDGFGLIDPAGDGGFSRRQAGAGATVEYDLVLHNSGTQEDEFEVWRRPEPPLSAVIVDGGAQRDGLFSTGPLAPGAAHTLTLRVTVPAALIGGDYTTFVHARSRGDTLRQDCVRAVTRVLAPRVDMIIGGSGDDIYDATGAGGGGSSLLAGLRSGTVIFPVVVQNEGGVRDSFSIEWAKPPGAWTAVLSDGTSQHVFPWTTPAFEPYSRREYALVVSVPRNAAYNTYKSILRAASSVDAEVRESVTAGICVVEGNEVDLIIDGNGSGVYGALGTGLGGSSSAAAPPGDTAYFTIVVENESGADAFDLQWTAPPGWTVLLGGEPSPLAGRPAGTYVLQVVIPADCAAESFDVVFDARKSNKPYFVDSVRGSVLVLSQPRVDALIDGDGDGVFGDPGTGAGGCSRRETIAGRQVAFSVELRNPGGEAETCVVDWSATPGWSASFDAQARPCTVAVAAGGSRLFTFAAEIPADALPGDYGYIIDFVSTLDASNTESVTAIVAVNPPPAPDLVIEGQGAHVTAPAGSGQGGRAMVFAAPGSTLEAALLVVNRGGFADSFRITWNDPAGWPSGAVVLSDGTGDYVSPFVTPLLAAGETAEYIVRAAVPADAALRSGVIIDGLALSSPHEDSVLLEMLSGVFIAGRVFEDADHDGIAGPGEAGVAGVSLVLSDPGAPLTAVTNADGAYLFEVPAGAARELIKTPPPGTVSLSPDTVAVGPAAAGDTLAVDFGLVYVSTIAPAHAASAPAGGFADLPHTITAAAAGQAALEIDLPEGWAAVVYRDLDGDGVLGGGDRPLQPADLDLDPAQAGRDVIHVIVRVFVPAAAAPGTIGACAVTLEQTLSGTALVTASRVESSVTVIAAASGNLRLVKSVDLPQAHPGEVVTYTIVFSNPGAEGVREIEIVDPVSASVELVAGAFGPGRDIAWTSDAGTVHLTFDPDDEDEALYDDAAAVLRVILSRRAPFTLESGAEGRIEYRVRIR